MRVGVVVGLSAEARIARRLGWPVAIGGGTTIGAEHAARSLVSEGAEALVSFGLAGGLDPGLRPGTLVIPSAVIEGEERYPASTDLSVGLGGMTPHMLLGSDTVAASVERKRLLYQQTGAAAVDLESGAVARVAAQCAVPFAALRAICDPAERALPPVALSAIDARGNVAAWRVLASIATHPRQLLALPALAADAKAAKQALMARVRRIADRPV
jgi:adenosylhomocysteine nucleosidase